MNQSAVRHCVSTLGDMTTPKSSDETYRPPLRLIDIAEAQARLGLSRTKVIALIDSGELTGVRIGTARRVLEESVDDLIRSLVGETDS